MATPTGQKRKDWDVEVKDFQFQSQAKATSRAADPSGEKRKASETAASSPVKAKIADPTWGKEKS